MTSHIVTGLKYCSFAVRGGYYFRSVEKTISLKSFKGEKSLVHRARTSVPSQALIKKPANCRGFCEESISPAFLPFPNDRGNYLRPTDKVRLESFSDDRV
jgi:hypothetical protein